MNFNKKTLFFIGFYRGMVPSLIGNTLAYGIYFFWYLKNAFSNKNLFFLIKSYEMFKKLFKTEPQTFKKIIKISLFASFLTSAVTEPFWVLQSKMAVKSKNTGFLDVFIKMMKNDGFMCFFKGLAASLFLAINPIIQFSVYELLKRKMSIFIRKI